MLLLSSTIDGALITHLNMSLLFSEVFGVPIYLCLWHVRRCWLKHLIKKVSDASTRAEMFRALGLIMNMRGTHSTCTQDKVDQAMELVRAFITTYTKETSFISYFKEQWLPQIGKSPNDIYVVLREGY